jgi:hypothetical protein
MANTKLKLKKSSVAGRVPGSGDLDYGEIAINYNDGKLYYKNSSNAIKSFLDSAGSVALTQQYSVDSSEVLNLIDSDYVSDRVSVTSIVDSAYVANLIGAATATEYTYQPSSDTTIFQDSDINGEVLSYTPGYIDVYLNGTRLAPSLDYTASTGSSVTFLGDAIGGGNTVSISGKNRVSLKDQEVASIDSDLTSTSQAVIDSFLLANYRSAKYIVQMSQPSSSRFQSTEVLLIHDGSVVHMTEYGTVRTDSDMGSLDAAIDGSLVKLKVTPTFANTEIKMKRIQIDT